ncbi:hypothetical protein [Nostoc sp. PCC 9305]|uniref:hypothetical protein n=1 Tax=Nostoc sp. PCC 9305 TaxID=296636 RepID=UPI0039C67F19
MPNEQPSVLIDLTPEYKQNLRDLPKRFCNIRSDVQSIIEQLKQGSFIGDRIAILVRNMLFIR